MAISATKPEPVEHEPGIYFDMPEEEYFADPALSASGMKHLLASPLDFWHHQINPFKKEREETDAMKIGKAFHKRLLEGKGAFYEQYAVLPDKDDFLVTAEDLKAYCEEHDLKKTGTKPILTERILGHNPAAPIWDRMVEGLSAKRIILSQDIVDDIEATAAMTERYPTVRGAIKDGIPEVSIFWVCPKTGVRKKCRCDYLKPTGTIIDLKTFRNPNGKPVDQVIVQNITSYKYSVQSVHYIEGIRAVREALKSGNAICSDSDFLDAFLKSDKERFIFLFRQVDGPMNMRLLQHDEFETFGRMGRQSNAYWIAADRAVNRATEIYKHWMDQNLAPEIPWLEDCPLRSLQDSDFPIWVLEKGYE